MFNLQLPFRSPFRGGGLASPQLSDGAAMLVQSLADKHAQAAKEGRLFIGSAAAAGTVLPIFSATAQKFGIWNPAGSGVIANVVALTMSYVSATGAAGGYVLAINRLAGAALATGGISAFTEDLEVDNALSGKLGGNKCKFTPSAATVIAPVIWRHLGLNQTAFTAAGTASAGGASENGIKFDGDCLVEPNTAVWVAGNISTICVWACSIAWVEDPI